MRSAEQAARRLELRVAAERATAAAGSGCVEAVTAAWYLGGLLAAREAYRDGGSAESLAPVRAAIAALEQIGGGIAGPAEIGRVTLLAAAAAAQSERDEMAVFLDFALRMEALQLAAGQPGAPGVAAHEVAGDLWLQVHRYADAARAYEEASRRIGDTPRVWLGRARAAARLELSAASCGYYGAFIAAFRSDRPGADEIVEAERFRLAPACSSEPPVRP